MESPHGLAASTQYLMIAWAGANVAYGILPEA
jgi:hypothetical protein